MIKDRGLKKGVKGSGFKGTDRRLKTHSNPISINNIFFIIDFSLDPLTPGNLDLFLNPCIYENIC